MSRAEQLADAAAATSVVTFLGMSLADWNSLIHIIAGLIAIIAGLLAIVFHIKRISDIGNGTKG